MDTDKEIRKVLHKLQYGSGSSLYGALIMMRTTLIKCNESLMKLVEGGLVSLMLKVLEDIERHEGKVKIVDIAMSILANICVEEDIRQKVSYKI